MHGFPDKTTVAPHCALNDRCTTLCTKIPQAIALSYGNWISQDQVRKKLSPSTSVFVNSRNTDGAPTPLDHQCPLESVASYLCHFMRTCQFPNPTTHRDDVIRYGKQPPLEQPVAVAGIWSTVMNSIRQTLQARWIR